MGHVPDSHWPSNSAETAAAETIVVAPGSSAATINAIIAALAMTATATRKKTVQLQDGLYTLETAIVAKSNVILRGVGAQTVLVPTFTGAADDLTNAVIKLDGALQTAVLNTSLTTDASKGASSVVVGSAGTIAANGYAIITGNNGGGQSYDGDLGMSDGLDVVLDEIVRVASSYAGGLTIPLSQRLEQSHAGPVKATVRGLAPVVGAEVHDLQIQGSQAGVVTAVGVLVRYAVEATVDGVSVSGCSRAAIDVEASKGFSSSRFRSLGTNNAWYYLRSLINGDIGDIGGAEDVARNHASGTPRWQIYAWARCTNVRVHDGDLVCGNGGFFHGGGVNLRFENITIRNQYLDVATYDRRVASGEWQSGGQQPLGWGAGHGPLSRAEFARGCQYNGISVDGLACENAAPLNTWIILAGYVHDTLDFVASALEFVHLGGSDNLVRGVVMSDCSGSIGSMIVKGFDYGLTTQNVYASVHVGSFQFSAPRAKGPAATIPLYLNHNGGSGPRFAQALWGNAFTNVRFGPSFAWDPQLLFRNLECDEGSWDYAILAYNATASAFAPGDIVEIDPTHTGADLRVRTPDTAAAGYERRLAAVVNGAPPDVGTGWILIAPLPQNRASVKATTAAVAYGDRIGYVATRRAVTDAAAGTLGIARTRKAAGAEGMVTVGPVT